MFVACSLLALSTRAILATEISWVSTTQNMNDALTQKNSIQFTSDVNAGADVVISVDEGTKYQTIYGIGSSLESSTAFNIMKLEASKRESLLKNLFDVADGGIGFNLMRITIGTSDFCMLPYYSYDDIENNGTDETLQYFSVSRDEEFIIPTILQSISASINSEILSSADKLEFFASPWSPPAWMKTSGKLEGGGLKTEYLNVYSEYLGKFIDAYAEHGIKISAITPQNEPLSSQTYPSVFFPPEEEANLIRNYLGPLMKSKGIDIWCFDHNWNTPYYPEHIFNDTLASSYVTGSGWHGYRGKAVEMSGVHDKFPDKKIFFTERSTYGVKGAHEIVAIFRNWASTYNAWVTMLDTDLQPNAGPFNPNPTMVMFDLSTSDVIYNLEFYMYGQFSKYIRRGAVRVSSETLVGIVENGGSDDDKTISHVAFVNDKSVSGLSTMCLVVVNSRQEAVNLAIQWNGMTASVELTEHSVSTFMWEI